MLQMCRSQLRWPPLLLNTLSHSTQVVLVQFDPKWSVNFKFSIATAFPRNNLGNVK